MARATFPRLRASPTPPILGCMAEMRIRGFDDETLRALRARAALEGITLNDLIVRILTEAADRLGPRLPRGERAR